MNKISLPLSPDIMVKFFQDKSIIFDIDFDASIQSLTESSMIRYLSNLSITCTIDKITDDLLLQYMIINEVCNISNLTIAHANVLYFAKYGKVLYPHGLLDFNEDNMSAFIANNMEVIIVQLMFLDSMLLYFLTRDEKFKSLYDNDNVDDTTHAEIGFSFLKLFELSDFLLIYSEDVPNPSDQTYYSRYFDDYMFGGKNLYSFVPTNAYFGLIAKLTLGYEDEDVRNDLKSLHTILSSQV